MRPREFLKPAEDVRFVIEASSVSISEWARANGFSAGLVYAVLKNRRKCLRGQSYRIAVALGLKAGRPVDVNTLSTMLSEGNAKLSGDTSADQEVPI